MKNYTFFRYILIFLIAAPVISALFYIHLYAVNVPYWDQFYHVIEGMVRYFNGSLSFEFLFSQGNESRPFFLRVISILLGLLTGYNLVFESFLGIIFATLSFIIIFLMYKKDHGISNISLLLFLPVAYFFFNLYQVGNYLFGFHYSHALAVLGFFTAVYFLDSRDTIDVRFLFALIASVIASFTYVGGLAIWLVGFIQIFLLGSLNRSKKLLLWSGSGIAVLIAYYSGYNQPAYHPDLLYVLHHAGTGITGFFISVGTAAFHDIALYPKMDVFLAPILGLFLILLILAVIILNWNNDFIRPNSKWLSLILFSLILSAEITIARSAYGLPYIYQMRYFLITYPAIIGVYCISLNCILRHGEYHQVEPDTTRFEYSRQRSTANYVLFGMILTLLIIGIASHDLQGIEYGQYYKESRIEMAYILKNYEHQTDERLVLLHPVGDSSMIPGKASEIRAYAAFLKNHNMSVFSGKRIDPGQLPVRDGNTRYWVDLINGEVTGHEPIIINRSADSEFVVEGYAIDAPANAPAGGVYISVDNRIYPALYSLRREDIARYFDNRELLNTGFRLRVSSGILREGEHNLSVIILTHDRTGVYRPEEQFVINVV